ncbi:proton-coupled amino acid transporter-like protein pathetic [Sitophilus oryzae]|uniref:Proton-coupled amino acid transporter-like protein pathetic n=1 Tax=Sitophilus oryzae TaxID=7048 RepID=A0A6J2XNE5_SITOR|nr:proton-coupled amino acid transporter-like protein pathetic [Sitophilus oryzae]
MDTLAHVINTCLGTGIISMPAAIEVSGLKIGVISTVIVSIICTLASYILKIHRKYTKTRRSFAEIIEEAYRRRPKWLRPFAKPIRHTTPITFFSIYFIICSCFDVIIAQNIKNIFIQYLKFPIRDVILIIPFIVLAMLPTLKLLPFISIVGNTCMCMGLVIILYYILTDIQWTNKRSFYGDFSNLPMSMTITIIALEAVGVFMPLQNYVDNCHQFTDICGAIPGMCGASLFYIILGFFGYINPRKKVNEPLNDNLPGDISIVLAINTLIAFACFCTFSLQFYMCMNVAWIRLKHKCPKQETLYQYGLRSIMTIMCIVIAIILPTILPYINLIGALLIPIFGLLLPGTVELITQDSFKTLNWKKLKDIISLILGTAVLIFGSKSAIFDIIALYSN